MMDHRQVWCNAEVISNYIYLFAINYHFYGFFSDYFASHASKIEGSHEGSSHLSVYEWVFYFIFIIFLDIIGNNLFCWNPKFFKKKKFSHSS